MKRVFASRRHVVVGLTGGIASGKSTALREFARLGAKTIDADAVSRAVSLPGSTAWKNIVRLFGKDILLTNKTINRRKLAQIVFEDALKMKILESITHPAIIKKIKNMIAALTRAGGRKIIIIDMPLLYEKKLENAVDKVIVVWSPKKTQISRMAGRDKLKGAQIKSRLKAQWPLTKKCQRADIVIDNSSGIAALKKQVEKAWEGLTKSDNSV